MTGAAGSSGGYELLALTAAERAQIEAQLSACFDLTAAGAHAWVETSARAGMYYGWKVGETVAASVAFEPLGFALGSETFQSLLLQSHYVHPAYRGQGYRVTAALLDGVLKRHGAQAIVLCLYEDALARYWSEVGFVLEHGRETITVAEALRRWAAAPAPIVTAGYLAVKREEAAADGAFVTEADGLVLLRARGSGPHTELLVIDLERALQAPAGMLVEQLEVTPIMSYPVRRGLFCPIVV